MARKKIEDTDLTGTTTEESPKPARRRRTAAELLGEAPLPTDGEATAELAAKPKRTRAKKADPVAAESAVKPAPVEATEPAAPRKLFQKSQPASEPVAEAPQPAEAKAKRPARKAPVKKAVAKAETQPEKAATQPAAEKTPGVLFRRRTLAEEAAAEPKPKRGRKPAPKAEINEPAAVVAEDTEVQVEAFVLDPAWERATTSPVDDYKGLTLSWRPRTRRPSRAARPAKTESEKPVAKSTEDKRSRQSSKEKLTLGKGVRDLELSDPEGRFGVGTWRTPSDRPKKAARQVETTSDDSDIETPRAEFRTRRSQGKKGSQQSAAPVSAARPKSEPPKITVRETVPRSEDAAQVVVVRDEPLIIKKSRIYSPFFFSAPADTDARLKLVLEEARLASENDIDIFSLPVQITPDEACLETLHEQVERQLAAFAEVNDQGQFILRIDFVAPDDWKTAYPKSVYSQTTARQSQPSIADTDYWSQVEECLKNFVSKLMQSEHRDRLLGLHLDRDGWYYTEAEGYDTSKAATRLFQEWLRHRYRDDVVTLRAAWYDGSVTFDNATVPNSSASSNGDFVRTDRRGRRWVDYHLFLSDMVVDRIGDLCYAAKQASNGDLLVGVSYGYTYEWSHPASGHLSLGKLLRCPEVDYIAGPPSTKHRSPGLSAPFPFPVDSFALNGKLFMSEADYRTPMGRVHDDEPGLMKTPQELESAHWRDAGCALAHKGGVCWMDTQGEGWLNSRGIWERAGQISKTLLQRRVAGQQVPDVALFIDERSLAYLVDERAFKELVQNVREAMLRAGLNVGFYLLSDLAHRENFPDSKLYVFVNAWDMRPEVRSAIKSRLQRDGKVLFWLHSAGLFEGGRESLERVREVTGIALRPQPFNSKSGTTLLNTRDPLAQHLPHQELSTGGQLEPSFFAIPEDALVLGEYTQTGLPSFVVRRFQGDLPEENWTSVFLGEPVVSPGFFRDLAQMAGAHVWNFDDDVVHATPPFLTVHCHGTGQRTLTLPDKWTAYNLTTGEYMAVDNNAVRYHGLEGSTYTFIVGTRGDVETILSADLETLRTLTEPVHRDKNTLEWDTIKFDVPIMRLDEWVEESWSEDHADDFLLKPSLLEFDTEALLEEHESPSSPGRRRRKRRTTRRGSEESADSRQEGADRQFRQAGVSVLFRKRE